jgi:protein transport protein SEC61 subunit gamma-like protein
MMEYKRVLKITKKPSMQEFKSVVKVTAIGALVVGAIGFLIHMAAVFIKTM